MPSTPLGGEVPLRRLLHDTELFRLSPRVFGCVGFVQDLTPGLDKLCPRTLKCVLVGYSRTQRGYRLYHPTSQKYYVSMDVTFFESQSFFSDSSSHDLLNTSSDIVLPIPVSVTPPVPIPSVTPPPVDPDDGRFGHVYHRRQHVPPPDPPPPIISPNDADWSLDLPIAFRKGIRSCTKHPISLFVSYDNLHPSFRTFAFLVS